MSTNSTVPGNTTNRSEPESLALSGPCRFVDGKGSPEEPFRGTLTSWGLA